MVEDREELVKYLDDVLREVQRRTGIVRELEGEIRNLEGELTAMRSHRVAEVRALQSQSGFRDSLTRKIEARKLELKVAMEDLERAHEREASIREELGELGD